MCGAAKNYGNQKGVLATARRAFLAIRPNESRNGKNSMIEDFLKTETL